MLGTTDRRLVENLFFDADATAAFNEVTGCLVWSDELPDGLSPDGFATMRDLLSARGLVISRDGVDRDAGTLTWNNWQRVGYSERLKPGAIAVRDAMMRAAARGERAA